MELYSNILDKTAIYNTLFLKIFTVTEYANLDELEKNDSDKHEIFKLYGNSNKYEVSTLTPEYSKIVGVSLCTVSNNGGNLKRNFQNIYNPDDEASVLTKLFYVLNELGKLPKPLLCGYNILGYDIPFMIKRAIKYNITIPEILKKAINSKPWESIAVDAMLLWKFGGNKNASLNEIVVFAGLKYKTLPMDEFLMNNKYWSDATQDDDWYIKETMNRLNLTLQLVVKLREM